MYTPILAMSGTPYGNELHSMHCCESPTTIQKLPLLSPLHGMYLQAQQEDCM